MKSNKFNTETWTGRVDLEDGDLGLRLHQIVQPYLPNSTNNSKVFVGFCSDEGVIRNKGRLGAKEAPNIIRKCLANLPIHFKNEVIFDYGNIIVDKDLELGRSKQIEVLSEILKQRNFPIIIGGGHETALGDFLSFMKRFPDNSTIINIDAHFDLRLPNEHSTSGTPFFEMYKYCLSHNLKFNYLVIGIQEMGNTRALFKRADDLQVDYIIADEMHANFNRILDQISQYITQFNHIYLSLDMDVFDVAYAPGVSAPSINGLNPFQVKYLIKLLHKSGKLRMMDVVEVNPTFDRDLQTSKLAAQLIYEVLRD